MGFLTQMKTPPSWADLSLLKVVKSALNTSALPISSLSHDSVPITTSGCMCPLSSRILMLYCKYSIQLTHSTTSDLPFILYANTSAAELTLKPTSTLLCIRLLGTDVPFSKCSHILLTGDAFTSSQLTLAYRCPSHFYRPIKNSRVCQATDGTGT
jgi:hypothetical protein